jgi:hypothetical protein
MLDFLSNNKITRNSRLRQQGDQQQQERQQMQEPLGTLEKPVGEDASG